MPRADKAKRGRRTWGVTPERVTVGSDVPPAASKWPRGNFANYYSIRRDVIPASSGRDDDGQGEKGTEGSLNPTPTQDKRVSAIVEWVNADNGIVDVERAAINRMLDVGCNCALVTLELARSLNDQPRFVMGVDVDDSLITRAQEYAWQSGYTRPKSVEQQRLEEKSKHSIGAGRLAGIYGSRSTLHRQPRKRLRLGEEDQDPAYTAALYAYDWVWADRRSQNRRQKIVQEAVEMEDRRGYDLITTLSVTKWIHLSHGDDGIRRFFARIVSTLHPAGILVLEPQPLKSYKSLHKVTKPDSQERLNWNSMQILPDDFPFVLTVEMGLKGPYSIRQKGKQGFIRDLQAYVKPGHPLDAVYQRHIETVLSSDSVCNVGRAAWVSRDRKAT